MCAHAYHDFGEDMSLAVYEKIKTQVLDYVKHVEIIGYGEPLLSKHFMTILDDCLHRGIKVSTTTNGTLLTETTIEKLVKGSVNLTLSVDGATSDVFNYVRPNVSFNKIIKVLETINKYRVEYENNDFNLYINMVVMKSNIHQVEHIVELANKYGAKRIIFFNIGVGCSKKLKEEIPSLYPELINKYFPKALTLAKDYGIEACTPNLFFQKGEESEPTVKPKHGSSGLIYPLRCYRPWHDAFFSVDGTVYPCCIRWMYADRLGNITNTDFCDIWKGERYQYLRRVINTNNPVGKCNTCCLPDGITSGDELFLTKVLEENVLDKFECHDASIEYIPAPATLFTSSSNRKYYKFDKNIVIHLPVIKDSNLVCIEIGDVSEMQFSNEGFITIDDSKPLEFDNTDRHILLALPINNSNEKFTVRINMNHSKYDITDLKNYALHIYNISYYKIDNFVLPSNKSELDFILYMDNVIQEMRLNEPQLKKMLIFGTNKNGELLYYIASKAGFNVIGYMDNYISYYMRELGCVQVYSINDLKSLNPDIILIASINNAIPIKDQIERHLIDKKIKIIYYLNT
ncbi:MAG: radical SAM protein [Nitrospirae bacterium]|nr:radical SAM protein [Nitrospirota bacterium]